MQLITKPTKKILTLIATFGVLLALQFSLTSCNSSPTSTTLPGAWQNVGISDFGGIPRSGAVGFVINDVAYVGTGFNYESNKRLRDFWKYDPKNNSWLQVADMPAVPGTSNQGRSNAVAFVMNGKAYVGTGTADGLFSLSDFWEFDPAAGTNGTWTQVANLGYDAIISRAADTVNNRYGAVAFGVNNHGFVGAGHHLSDLQDMWEFDRTTGTYGTWVLRPSFPGKKRQNSFVMIIKDASNNEMAYVGSGTDNNSLIKDFYKFDVTKLGDGSGNPWTELSSLIGKDLAGNAVTQPKPRELASTFTINGMGYLVCGNTGGVNGETWQYNPNTDVWVQQYSFTSNWPTAGSARAGAVGFGIGSYGYITTGGSGASFKFDDCWRFDPTGKEPDNK